MEDAIRDREAVAQRLEEEVRAFLEKATLAKEEMLLQTRDEMLDLCIAVAEKVVRVSLRSSSEVIVRMIQTATERLKRQEWVHIYISGCDAGGDHRRQRLHPDVQHPGFVAGPDGDAVLTGRESACFGN